MTAIDHWAAIAAGVACIFLGLRAELLKPTVAKFHTAPMLVVLALAILSIAMAAAVVSIWWGGGHATVREAWVYSGIAVSAVILFWNVHRQRAPSLQLPGGIEARMRVGLQNLGNRASDRGLRTGRSLH
ncbi:hypothetical protein [Phenylobacterium sp.]|uniref:hypothetical protein n=1 Tax=Phenylobacterium sp. TaxID=1871053 RepID=UPI0030F37372